jgi:uncharacterized protein
MKCPTCTDSALTITERQGVEIDYCPQCRGVWLDRGELDKLMDRAVAAMPQASTFQGEHSGPMAHSRPSYRPDFADSDHRGGYGARRKKSWLNEIFD